MYLDTHPSYSKANSELPSVEGRVYFQELILFAGVVLHNTIFSSLATQSMICHVDSQFQRQSGKILLFEDKQTLAFVHTFYNQSNYREITNVITLGYNRAERERGSL